MGRAVERRASRGSAMRTCDFFDFHPFGGTWAQPTPGSPPASYFCVGAWFCGTVGGADGAAGVAGCDFVCDGFTPESTDVGPVRRAAKIESVIDVSMKMIADQVVARERTEAAPRGPNAVWLPCPPKAAARSPLFPLCSKTTAIRKKQTIT